MIPVNDGVQGFQGFYIAEIEKICRKMSLCLFYRGVSSYCVEGSHLIAEDVRVI